MKPDIDKYEVSQGLARATHFAEGITSLLAGSYVLSLALLKSNVALRLALGIAGGYLVLRSGSKLRAGSFGEDIATKL